MERSAWGPIVIAAVFCTVVEPTTSWAQLPALPRSVSPGQLPPSPSDVSARPIPAATSPTPAAGIPDFPTPTRSGRDSALIAASQTASAPVSASLPNLKPLAGTPSAGEEFAVKLEPAPLESTDLRFPINLATALRLSDARPLVVAAAQASVWVAEARLTRAKYLWVPTFMFGFDYIRHDGGGPDFNKGILTAPSVNYFYGGGSFIQVLNVTDAIFEPLAARQVLNARNWDIQAAKNDALLDTADAYFKVHMSRGMFAGSLYCVERGNILIERITRLSKDLVPKIEIDRSKNLVADLEQRATSAREAWRVSSADLTQVLRLDPRAVIVPQELDHLQITLIDPALPLEDLLRIAVINRPELASQKAMVEAAEARVRQEKMRPLLPVVELNGFQSAGNGLIQAGIFGIGPNSSLNQWTGREDTSIQFMWQFEAFGLGNLARVKQKRGEQSKAIVDLYHAQDMVARDVTQALARLQSATARIVQADRALRTAIITFNGNLEGLGQTIRFGDVLKLVYRPQEVVYALQLMKVAFDEYFTTVSEYNRAQFQMFHALGYPAREIAYQHLPGEVMPVETARPSFLPPVTDGPPPATR